MNRLIAFSAFVIFAMASGNPASAKDQLAIDGGTPQRLAMIDGAAGHQTGEVGTTKIPSTVSPAPIGHRQPRAIDASMINSARNADVDLQLEDATVDRKISGICRGC
jgi:hypothetical protein